MRIYRYKSRGGGFQPRLAVAVDDQPVDLLRAWDEVTGTRLTIDTHNFLVSPLHLIEQGPEVWKEVRDVSPLLGSRNGLDTAEDSMEVIATKVAELVHV